MEVTRTNFKETLSIISDAIKEATFIAIDGEFTGLNSGKILHGFDTPNSRYQKIREGAMEFLLVQFGLCTFKYDKNRNRYETKPFNFYIFPRPFGRQSADVKFYCQSSSIDFLSNVGFDFNKLFKQGIPYLSPCDERRLREQLEQRHQQFSSTPIESEDSRKIATPDEHKAFIEDICKKITRLIESDEQSLELEPCNAYLRKLIYQNVKSRFKSGIHLDTKIKDARERYIKVFKADVEQMKEMEVAKKSTELDELDEAVGFSKVIKMISKSEKLIVGHNMLLDLCHILHQFCSPLPVDFEEFKSLSKYVFPRILDTKLMASTQPLRDIINTTTLGELQVLLEKNPFVKPEIVTAPGFTGYNTSSEQLHEAGYDAYVTGICFVTMADHLGSLQDEEIKISVECPIVEPFINKLFLMRVQDIPYINLNGEDELPPRTHVFHVKFPKEWKTSDLVQLFQPFGSVYVAWVDDNSAFVALNKKNQANVVMRTLTQSETYHVQTYDSYIEKHGDAKTTRKNSWPTDVDETSDWPSKKRQLPKEECKVTAKRTRSVSASEANSTKTQKKSKHKKPEKKTDMRIGKAKEKKKTNVPSDASSHKIFEEDNVWE
uniref:Poly(A)-specific ribonuclease PARN n=1 Tax=Strigamia maritima TaxID=126957 RepID=T1JBS2_STRMM